MQLQQQQMFAFMFQSESETIDGNISNTHKRFLIHFNILLKKKIIESETYI